jgi:sialic acid synthase SpsE/protoporphyrinogen oxidase
MKKEAFILGAGPAGLVAAWKLLENGWNVQIFEKNSIVGGMCRSWKWRDFILDTGPHIFHTPDEKLAKFWEEEFGDLWLKGEFWCKNVKGEKFDEYWDYPLSWESISRYPRTLKENILRELQSPDEERKARANNYQEYITAQVGSTLAEMFFQTYPEKIWGIPTSQMTAEWAPKRIEFRQKITPFYHGQWNAVGKYGTGCIYERIREKIENLGGQIHLGKEVREIKTDAYALNCIRFSNGDQVTLQKNDVVISSLPITLTAQLLGFKSTLKFRGICSVYLAYDRDSILPEGIHWLYYGAKEIYFNRVTEPKKLSPYVAPRGKTYLTVEITYSKGDEIDSMSPDELMMVIASQVEKVGLAPKAAVVDMSLNKEGFVYPLQYTGYQEELSKTSAAISRFQALYSIGTGGSFNYSDSQVIFHKVFDLVSVLCDKEAIYTQVVRQTPQCIPNKIVTIGNKKVGDGAKAFIVAEAGMNHNGSLQLAKTLVDCAVMAGCDAIKFQTFSAKNRVSEKVKAANYSEQITGLEESIFQMFDRLAMPFKQQKALFEYAREKGIEIFSTPFDFESVDFLETMAVSLYKIASMDLVNLPLIRHVAQTGKPIILSTGMSTLGEIEEAVEIVTKEGNANLILLHCNSSYPAAPSEMNLNAISTLRKCFNVPVGLSDHTLGLFVSHTAIAIGADMIERHFTLDRTLEGPDHILSSEPEEMAKLVAISEMIPSVMGDGVKKIKPNEYTTLNMQRKSIYAACNIQLGEVITEKMVTIKGPGGGLLPRYLNLIIGRKARKEIEEDYPITWNDV